MEHTGCTEMMAERDNPSATECAIDALRDRSPSARLLGLYRYGIEGCKRRDTVQVAAVLEELIGSLDYDAGEIAEGFHRLYSACLAKCCRNELSDVAWVLRELHAVWLQAFDDSLAIPEIPLVPADVARRARASRFERAVAAGV
jgi:hypothetical protein